MTAATKEQLAAKLAQAIYEEIATPLFRARDRAAQVFRGLRIRPVMTVDPLDGSLGFSFTAGHAPDDVDATLELMPIPPEMAGAGGAEDVPRAEFLDFAVGYWAFSVEVVRAFEALAGPTLGPPYAVGEGTPAEPPGPLLR
jgi:hypothetical protein